MNSRRLRRAPFRQNAGGGARLGPKTVGMNQHPTGGGPEDGHEDIACVARRSRRPRSLVTPFGIVLLMLGLILFVLALADRYLV